MTPTPGVTSIRLRSASSLAVSLTGLPSVALLAYRIWSQSHVAPFPTTYQTKTRRFAPVMRIILESGLINAAFLFAFVMTLVFGSSSLEIMSSMVR